MLATAIFTYLKAAEWYTGTMYLFTCTGMSLCERVNYNFHPIMCSEYSGLNDWVIRMLLVFWNDWYVSLFVITVVSCMLLLLYHCLSLMCVLHTTMIKNMITVLCLLYCIIFVYAYCIGKNIIINSWYRALLKTGLLTDVAFPFKFINH